jgi:Fe-S-cluster containining protein
MSNPFPECEQCGHCCEFLSVPLAYVMPNDKLAFWLETRGIPFQTIGNHLWLKIDIPCPHLSPGGWCTIYDKRPRMCEEGKCVKGTIHDNY